jgi:hypothetical protein
MSAAPVTPTRSSSLTNEIVVVSSDNESPSQQTQGQAGKRIFKWSNPQHDIKLLDCFVANEVYNAPHGKLTKVWIKTYGEFLSAITFAPTDAKPKLKTCKTRVESLIDNRREYKKLTNRTGNSGFDQN